MTMEVYRVQEEANYPGTTGTLAGEWNELELGELRGVCPLL
jgi:hypothetical protein